MEDLMFVGLSLAFFAWTAWLLLALRGL